MLAGSSAAASPPKARPQHSAGYVSEQVPTRAGGKEDWLATRGSSPLDRSGACVCVFFEPHDYLVSRSSASHTIFVCGPMPVDLQVPTVEWDFSDQYMLRGAFLQHPKSSTVNCGVNGCAWRKTY